MILILGADSYEQGTNPVIDWLNYYKADFLKLSINNLFFAGNEVKLNLDTQEIYYNEQCLNQKVSVVWYRQYFQKSQFISSKDHDHA
ncbi:MAG: hypothetical protein AAFO94_20790, partial [Bacteroidota bacterium]